MAGRDYAADRGIVKIDLITNRPVVNLRLLTQTHSSAQKRRRLDEDWLIQGVIT